MSIPLNSSTLFNIFNGSPPIIIRLPCYLFENSSINGIQFIDCVHVTGYAIVAAPKIITIPGKTISPIWHWNCINYPLCKQTSAIE
ncbi:hypothetical protein ES705_46032 [subsurface metagenome]